MSNIGVYGILCTANGKWYVGQTMNLWRRRLSHITPLTNGTHKNQSMCEDAERYGSSCFEFHVLEEVHPYDLRHEESKWIHEKRSNYPTFGYNIQDGSSSKRKAREKRTAKHHTGRHFYQGVPVLVDFATFERNLKAIA